ncbi:MAG TPA: inorganic diphosphatase [Chloroflexota bacterium]|nr:inorganic diphosphatase [Chloroflexota bacterium]
MADKPLQVIIEIPRGSRNKYEYDHVTHRIRLDRVLHSAVHYPTDYGFIPETLAQDGDPLDVMVIVEEPNYPGVEVPVRPIGVLRMRDEKGSDEKILAVPVNDPRFDEINSLDDVRKHWLREIEMFFATYKLLEDKETDLEGWDDEKDAARVIADATERFVRSERAGREL